MFVNLRIFVNRSTKQEVTIYIDLYICKSFLQLCSHLELHRFNIGCCWDIEIQRLQVLKQWLWIVQKPLVTRLVCAGAGAVSFLMTLPVLKAPGAPALDSRQTQCHLEEKAWPCTPRHKGNMYFRGINVPNETRVRTKAVFPSSLSFCVVCVRGHRAWHEGFLGNSFVINHKEYLSDLGHSCLSIISSLYPFSRVRRANNNFDTSVPSLKCRNSSDSELFLCNWRQEPAGARRRMIGLHSRSPSKGPAVSLLLLYRKQTSCYFSLLSTIGLGRNVLG